MDMEYATINPDCFTITSFKKSFTTNTAKFSTLFCEALQDMKDVMLLNL